MLSRILHKTNKENKKTGKRSSYDGRTEQWQNSSDELQKAPKESGATDQDETEDNVQTGAKQEQSSSLSSKKEVLVSPRNSVSTDVKYTVNNSQFFFSSDLPLTTSECVSSDNDTNDDDQASIASEDSPFKREQTFLRASVHARSNSPSEAIERAKNRRSQSFNVMPRARETPYKQTRRLLSFAKKTDEGDFAVKYVRVHGPSDGAYKNQSEPRGFIFIKNFERFDNNKFSRRSGSLKDYNNLVRLFEEMGYKKCKKCCESGHITKEKFLRDLEAFRNLDHKLYDSTIIIIMSHGVRDKTFVTSDNEEVDLLDVYSIFSNDNCEGLKNKPKIFILQFCRPKSTMTSTVSSAGLMPLYLDDQIDFRIKEHVGLMKTQLKLEMQQLIESSIREALKDMNVTPAALPALKAKHENDECLSSTQISSKSVRFQLNDSALETGSFETDAAKIDSTASIAFSLDSTAMESTPDYSDMYSIFSTNSGGVSYRDPKKGSLLIQAICQVFSNHAYQDDIEELVRKVSKRMQQELSKDDPLSSHRHAVVERVNNGLDKAFYFNPFEIKDRKRYITLA